MQPLEEQAVSRTVVGEEIDVFICHERQRQELHLKILNTANVVQNSRMKADSLLNIQSSRDFFLIPHNCSQISEAVIRIFEKLLPL